MLDFDGFRNCFKCKGGVRGKFPKVAVEYAGPDRIHQVRPSHDASVRATTSTLFSMVLSAVLGFKVLSQMN